MAFDPICAGVLRVRLAETEAEITASQKLRYRVFCEEMGGKASPEIQAQKRDFDQYDEVCDHLLVIDADQSENDGIVGTYRLLRRGPMAKVGQFYTESEYDISALKDYRGELLELGRSCVDARYRNRSVMTLLWRGIGAYTSAHQIKLMFGCASFTGADPKPHALALSYLYHFHLAEPAVLLKALPELYTKMDWMPKDQINEREALRDIPPLIKGYLRLNGKVGDGAFLDYAYNTTDVSIVVEIDQLAQKYFERYAPGERD